MGTVLGAILGLTFSHLMKFSHRRGYIDRESYVAQYLALAIFITGVVSTLGSDDLLAAFAAGSAISWDGEFNDHTEGEIFASVIDLVLNCACFIYIGAWLPFEYFNSPELGITPWRWALDTFLLIEQEHDHIDEYDDEYDYESYTGVVEWDSTSNITT
ncbi:hypothetical protein H0H93_014586 [Arthromyces matolae]|nr:hypothetical protein H0H93_014586 [Arthromyces matolae]